MTALQSKSDIAARRLVNQQIAQPKLDTPAEVVGWLGAMQGQDYAGAKWSIGLRLPGSTDAAIEQALADRSIVRSWILRGTLHFAAAADLRWLIELVAQRVLASNTRRYKELELDAPTLARSTSLLAQALEDGTPRDRDALLAMLQEHEISTQGQRAFYMLQHASLHGLICQGPAPRNTPIFMSIEKALPRAKPLEREHALAELARRYFTSHGPATLKDFIWWSGLAPADARLGLAASQAQLSQATLEGQTYWMPAHDQHTAISHPSAYLLPGFDEYVLGYTDRSAVLAQEYSQRIVPGGNGMFMPTIVSNGEIVGTWKRTAAKSKLIVTAQPFRALSHAEHQALEAAAPSVGQFLELPVSLQSEEPS